MLRKNLPTKLNREKKSEWQKSICKNVECEENKIRSSKMVRKFTKIGNCYEKLSISGRFQNRVLNAMKFSGKIKWRKSTWKKFTHEIKYSTYQKKIRMTKKVKENKMQDARKTKSKSNSKKLGKQNQNYVKNFRGHTSFKKWDWKKLLINLEHQNFKFLKLRDEKIPRH